nr:hypothetical protein [uncultured Blautia sp.]
MTKFEIEYKNGRGKFAVDLEQLLPCSTGDFKRLLSFVNLSSDPAGNADKLFSFMACQVEDLKKAREKENSCSSCGKEKIAKINAALKKYISHAAALSKDYGTPEITDDAAKIILKSAKVYSLIRENGVNCVKEFDGWTFEKSGFTFDVRKDENRRYIIMLHGTGLKCAMADKKSQVPLEITPAVIELLNASENQERISEAENHCKKLMIKAGYIQPEKCQEKQEEKDMQEEKKNVVEYSITGTGSVLMFVVIGEKENGRLEKQRVTFAPDHPDYNAVLSAAIRYGCKRPENILSTVPAKEESATVPEEKNGAEESRNPKAARGPVPEKTFVGQSLQGNGWKIYFDGVANRTRVIFSVDPSKKAIKVVENAGFYYSSKMNSWNKKLTFKAYRAAQELAKELTKAYGDAA